MTWFGLGIPYTLKSRSLEPVHLAWRFPHTGSPFDGSAAFGLARNPVEQLGGARPHTAEYGTARGRLVCWLRREGRPLRGEGDVIGGTPRIL